MGMWPFVSDLRTGAMSGGSGEEAVLSAAGAQIINWIGPSLRCSRRDGRLEASLTPRPGTKRGSRSVSPVKPGANLVYESAGMLASLLACSPEMMVIDNDLLGAANRTVRGVEVNEDTLSMNVINDVVHGAGHFLGHEQTLRLMEKDYVYPQYWRSS